MELFHPELLVLLSCTEVTDCIIFPFVCWILFIGRDRFVPPTAFYLSNCAVSFNGISFLFLIRLLLTCNVYILVFMQLGMYALRSSCVIIQNNFSIGYFKLLSASLNYTVAGRSSF